MKVRVYRVETPGCMGMYSSEISAEMHEMRGRHPAPGDDMKLGREWWSRFQGDIHFGFYSLEQFKFWVYKSEWREGLKDEGFRISVYEVPIEAVVRGDTQAIFDMDRATKLHSLCPTEV